MNNFHWTPDVLAVYTQAHYRVRAGVALPMVVLRLDGWQVGERWCLSSEEACDILNQREALPIASESFKRGTSDPLDPRLGMTGESAGGGR